MATWNRGRHILPSIRSVLQQTVDDFELYVIGDNATDDTESFVNSIDDARLHWRNSDTRWGCQSGPNRLGLQLARAPWIAYLGHDDIWLPTHLENIRDAIARHPDAKTISAGVLSQSPVVSSPYRVLGLGETSTGFRAEDFVPPSGMAHRVTPEAMACWKPRLDATAAVDVDFQQDFLGRDGLRVTTGRVTALKFTASSEYLSYLQKRSNRQIDALNRIASGDIEADIRNAIDVARANGRYMDRTAAEDAPASKHVSTVDASRGLVLPALIPLGEGCVMEQTRERRALDWRWHSDQDQGFRWSGPNHCPRLLVPVSYDGIARVRMEIGALRDRGFPQIGLSCDEQVVPFSLEVTDPTKTLMRGQLYFYLQLRADAPTILTLHQPEDIFAGPEPTRSHGLAVGPLHIAPKTSSLTVPPPDLAAKTNVRPFRRLGRLFARIQRK
jgi:glycosyltransferase involved in cell wall biosynthesis